MFSRTFAGLAAATALLGGGLTLVGAVDGNAATKSPALCVDDPNPEPGIQGDVPSGSTPAWDCGVRPVGFLEGANGAMAVAHHCAYTGGGADETEEDEEHPGVRVIDVSEPTAPRLVRVLDTGSRELLAAQVSPDGSRSLLATRHRDTVQQEGQVLGRDMLVDVWDISTCTDPQLLGTAVLPTINKTFGDPPAETGGPAHNLKFNPSATKLYGSIPLHEVDLTSLDPATWTVRNLHCSITDQHHLPHETVPGLCATFEEVDEPGNAGGLPQTDHEPTFSPDGSRLYIGGQLPMPDSNALWILDVTYEESPDPIVLSVTDQAPGHSIDFMTIKDEDGNPREYLLHSNEIAPATACIPERLRPNFLGFADRAFVLDITDETAPVKTSEIMLDDSRFDNCGPGNTGGPSTAYHDVDDPTDTSYAIIGFELAGFRIFDVRNPREPVEVAYFNHGESQHTKSYVIPETGHIWASDANGFWVLELEPQVIEHLRLSPPSAEACDGDGWEIYSGEDDEPFANQGECVSFVARRAASA